MARKKDLSLFGPTFRATPEEKEWGPRVIARAMELAKQQGRAVNWSDMEMDLVAAHRHIPLDFPKLMKASDEAFSSDIWGIRRYLDRETETLRDGFIPRHRKE